MIVNNKVKVVNENHPDCGKTGTIMAVDRNGPRYEEPDVWVRLDDGTVETFVAHELRVMETPIGA